MRSNKKLIEFHLHSYMYTIMKNTLYSPIGYVVPFKWITVNHMWSKHFFLKMSNYFHFSSWFSFSFEFICSLNVVTAVVVISIILTAYDLKMIERNHNIERKTTKLKCFEYVSSRVFYGYFSLTYILQNIFIFVHHFEYLA